MKAMEESRSSQEFRQRILDRLDAVIESCQEQNRPLEMDPARSELFELFVAAERAGALSEDSDLDLTADAICRLLSERWGLKAAAVQSVQQQVALPPEHLARMRSLWSVMRMWMEWTYAWEQWPNFHSE